MVIALASPVNYFFSRWWSVPMRRLLKIYLTQSYQSYQSFLVPVPTSSRMSEGGQETTLGTLVTLREAHLFLPSARLLRTRAAAGRTGAAEGSTENGSRRDDEDERAACR